MIAVALAVLLTQAPAKEQEEIDKAFAEETPRKVKVTLTDGRIISGRLLLRDELQLLIETESGEPVQIDADDVKRFEEPLSNRNRSRYLFAGSALMPDVGQVTVAQVQLLATIFEVGISEHFSFQIGGSLPAYFIGVDGVNAFAAVKAGTSLNRYIHLALELKFLVLGLLTRLSGQPTGVPATGLAAVTATFGTEDFNATVSVGPPFDLGQLARSNGSIIGVPVVMVNAFVRVAQNVGLITENWVVPPYTGTGSWFVADALGARFFGQKWAVDLGILVMPTQFLIQGTAPGVLSPVPGVLPWLNFAYHFT